MVGSDRHNWIFGIKIVFIEPVTLLLCSACASTSEGKEKLAYFM